jgi:hypothetical protein
MKDMKRNKGYHKNSEDYSNSFSLVEDAIDLSIQEEYFNLSQTSDFDNVDYKDVLRESKKLFSENTPIETKKKILILLAHFGTAESYRTIKKYLNHSGQELKDWVLLSLKECRIFLESALLEEEEGLLSTGPGGKDNKLRYYFIVSSKGGLIFAETHRNTLKKGFETISQKYNSEIEEINFETNYAMIGIFIPMDVAVGDVIEEGISECNKMNEFLIFHYYITNVKKPANEEILKYLDSIGISFFSIGVPEGQPDAKNSLF